ncbi:restriction endonuclease subunit S [Metamycoplasma equirhinis]|uniref:restriction endonuclease subunit S n=1 Tax=Metamycoplasma equirhinis TaxID=92402 RepID=UPI0035946AB7
MQRQTKEIIDIGELLLQKSSQNKPIIDYASILLGGTPSRKHPEYWNGSIKWINSGAITGTPAIQNESELITVAGVENSATKCAYEGDSVLSIIEPSKNKVAVVLDNEVYFNQSVICLHPNDIKYKGLIFFSSRLLIDRIKGYATGAAQQSLNKDMIEKENILVPKDADIIKLNNLLLKIVKNENKVRKLKSIKEKLLEKYF